jgi:hypothetical protein
MMKLIACILAAFAVVMCVPTNEGAISFSVENTWAASGPGPGESRVRFVRFRSSQAPRPEKERGFLVGNRWHFGFPCWAVYVDTGREQYSGLYIWYAKADLVRSLANLLFVVPIGAACAWLLSMIGKRKQRGVPNNTPDGICQPADGSPKPSV